MVKASHDSMLAHTVIKIQCSTGMHVAGNAAQQLVEAAERHAGSLTVIASGPLTNIAHAVQQNPHLVSNGMPEANTYCTFIVVLATTANECGHVTG